MTRKQKLATAAAVAVAVGAATVLLIKPLPSTQRFTCSWDKWTAGIGSPLAGRIILRHSTNLVTWDFRSYPKTATNATITVAGAPAHFFNIGYSLAP